MSYPRVLIVNGDPINTQTPTGITLANLFHGWDMNCIAQIYSFPMAPDTNYCEQNWPLSKSLVPLHSIYKNFLDIFKRPNPFHSGPSRLTTASMPSGVKGTSSAAAWADTIPLHVPSELYHRIHHFRPSLIYSNFANIRIIRLSIHISNYFNLPIVPHFMDDWPTTKYAFGMGSRVPQMILKKKLQEALSHSKFAIAISEAMAQEFHKRYLIPFHYFMCTVDTNTAPSFQRPEQSRKFCFRYVGGVHLNRWKPIMRIANALNVLTQEGYSSEFIVHCPMADLDFFHKRSEGCPGISLGKSLMFGEIPLLLRSSDVLVHVESFDKTDQDFTRFSISTKIPQYLAAGRAIFCLGPSGIASCEYIRNTNSGIVLGECNDETLLQTLRTMMTDHAKRESLGRNGYLAALSDHDIISQGMKFQTLLHSATD